VLNNKPNKNKLANKPLNKINPAEPDTIPKFVDEVKRPSIARAINQRYISENKKANKAYFINKTGSFPHNKSSQPHPYYEINMKETKHRFHKLFPPTTVWGYNGMIPGPTIEATKDKLTRVKWINNLPSKHLLPLDHTLHGSIDTPDVRSVVHLHGAHVDWKSDGHPEAWYTKNYKITGPTFTRKVHEYTNHQPGTTLWYHDHSMGLTRLNVYAGLAGFYLLRDTLEKRLKLPSGKYEIPLMIQDKSFNQNGSLFYLDAPPFPVSVHPSIVPGFFGNTIVVNGKVWPYLRVEPRKYRFRILNASNRRGYVLYLSNNQSFTQIGTDGGLLSTPVSLTSIELLPAERTDIIIDFSNFKGQEITLKNSGENINEHTSIVMQFKVDLPLSHKDTSQIPQELYPPMDLHEHMAHTVRNLTLSASTDSYGRPMLMLDNRMWHDPATEKPSLDSIEIWNFINLTANAHPIHIHLVQFKILERRPFNVQRYENEGVIEYTGPSEPPREYERGWKDTVKADGGMITKIIMHFKEHTGNYVWHCHFLEHEDHDMMRPIRIIEDSHSIQIPHIEEPHSMKNKDH
jgi:spore coat protein A